MWEGVTWGDVASQLLFTLSSCAAASRQQGCALKWPSAEVMYVNRARILPSSSVCEAGSYDMPDLRRYSLPFQNT